MEQIRVGIIGLGLRGYGLTNQVFLKMDDIRITAVCDIYQDRVERVADLVENAGNPRPYETSDYKKLVNKNLVDCVIVITSWKYHT